MDENYQLFEGILQKYFDGNDVSGSKLRNPQVSLLRVEEGTWRNFWTEKAVYEMRTTEETDRFSTFSMYADVKHGELIVRKRRGNLLVDLMSTYKTRQDKFPLPLTLENSFQVPLN